MPPSPGHLPGTTPHLITPAAATCSGTWGNTDPVAAVSLHGSTAVVLRDYADITHPRTLCTFTLPVLAILDPHHVVALDTASNAISTPSAVVELPSARVFDIAVAGPVSAVAPDLSQVLWVNENSSTPSLHDSWDSQDKLIQTYPQVNGICGVGPVPGAWSRDSKYGFATWTQGLDASYLNVVASDHTSAFVSKPPPGGWLPNQVPVMALWSPTNDRLLWTQANTIQQWSPSGGIWTLRTNLTWQYPAMSSDGTHLAYVLSDSSGNSTIHLLNPTTGAELGALHAGTLPMFLTPNWLWFKVSAGGCGPQDPTSYIYDFSDHTFTASSLDWVYATWPATSALGG